MFAHFCSTWRCLWTHTVYIETLYWCLWLEFFLKFSNDILTMIFFIKTSFYRNVFLSKRLFIETSFYQNVSFSKYIFIKISFHQNIFSSKYWLSTCPMWRGWPWKFEIAGCVLLSLFFISLVIVFVVLSIGLLFVGPIFFAETNFFESSNKPINNFERCCRHLLKLTL